MTPNRSRVVLAMLAASAPLYVHAADAQDSQTLERLEQHIEEMQKQFQAIEAQQQREIEGLRRELEQLRQQHAVASTTAQPATQPQPSTQPQPAKPSQGSVNGTVAFAPAQTAASESALPTQPGAPPAGPFDKLNLWGYGEIYYTRPTHQGALTQFDLARAVFGIGYHFNDNLEFNSEYEVEHAVASAADRGEFEVEQFYVDDRLTNWASLKLGLFLMPFGLLNEHHEPTNFYGVQRNFVETLIIPSTWREGGLGLHGTTPVGLSWDVGLTSGFDIGAWQVNPEEPLYRTALELEDSNSAPLQATHQELQLANAQHLSQYVSLNYSGVPGLYAGAAIFTGKAAVPLSPPGLPDERVTLWETHVRWSPGAAEFTALYARGQISNTAPFNLANVGASNPLPAQFLGYYAQGAYTVWDSGRMRLTPFVRWEHYDMGSRYQGIPQGFTSVPQGLASDGLPWPQPRDRVWTFGANFYIDPHVVLKADYQSFHDNADFTRFDLGLGVSF